MRSSRFKFDAWTRERVRLGLTLAALYVAIGLALRAALQAAFGSAGVGSGTRALALGTGFVADVAVGLLLASVVVLAVSTSRAPVLHHRAVRFLLVGTFAAALSFGAAVEYFFFEEFDARFNHVAIDYLLHPKEVFVNIWDSYDVPAFVTLSAAIGLIAGALAARRRGGPSGTAERGSRRRLWVLILAIDALAAAPATGLPSPSDDRVENEIAANGLASLLRAVRTAEIPYEVYYRTLAPGVAHRRAEAVLHAGAIAMHGPRRDWDVVVILEESLGSEFVGVLGHPERRTTPQLDAWSRHGLLLTNLYATGNRTVRGLEGTLCSFVPLPGDAVIKRPRKFPVATLASVLRAEGYDTAFFYGGWGVFDSMKPFFLANGYGSFIERGDFPGDPFATIWGVADEFVFDEMLRRQIESARSGRRLFATLLTTSNHKPYDVPARPTSVPAALRNREAAVAYADWALGRYLDRAEREGLLRHTIVMIVGDHGARVYGSEQIPVASYRIPGLILVPERGGATISRTASQVDLAPTLLSILGYARPEPFLGTDLTRLASDGGRAFVGHNRDVGILTDTRLVTLGLHRTWRCYTRGDRSADAFLPADCGDDAEFASLRDDAAAVFQTASDTLRAGPTAGMPDRASLP